MRILALSDTHFGYEYGRTSEVKSDQIQSTYTIFSKILDVARKKHVDLILHGGDVFNRSIPKKSIISKAYQIIENHTAQESHFIAIPGNHDKSQLPETLLNHLCKNIL